ncbi:hypothetical protein B0H14DRAFT_2595068 [Mycena olivaceomarginata]|nr:hypothetical protein B0H14DRAFT_2595068 [Mycena olivaceomarginata]
MLPPITSPPLAAGLEPMIDPYGAGFAGLLGSDLLMQLEKMTPEAREARVVELKGLNAQSLERANNTTQNHYLLNNLGLGDAQKEALWGGVVAHAKRKVETWAKQHNGRQSTKGVRPRAEKGTGSSGWAEKANKFLTNAEYGSKWVDVLVLWWKREEDAGFEGTMSKAVQLLSMTKSHPTKKCPKEVGDWVSRAQNHTLQIDSPEEFGKRWEWWIDINPSWHKRTVFLNVLEDTIDDVTWVLRQMAEDNGSTEEPLTVPTNDAATPGTGGTNTNGNSPCAPVSIGGSQRRSGITVNKNDEGAQNRVIPSRTEITHKEGGARPGTEGLSQEELDKMENNSQADMEEDQ